MLPIAVSFLIGCIIGILLIIIPIIKRKFLQPWVLMLLIIVGFMITIGCAMMFLCISFVIGPSKVL